MGRKEKRNLLKPGAVTSYKLPKIKDGKEKEFYRWLNSKKSINGTITDALKLKFMIERVNLTQPIFNENIVKDKNIIVDVDTIDVFCDEEKEDDVSGVNIDMIMKTIESIKR